MAPRHHGTTVSVIVQKFKNELKNLYDEKEIMQFLYLLFRNRMNWSRADLHINKDQKLEEEIVIYFNEACSRLAGNEPVQYIIGVTDFLGSTLTVNPSVLIPRPETEELVTLMIHDLKSRNRSSLSLIDIGTGSGCIALAIKKQFPEMKVYGCDISQQAVALASGNAINNNCDITFLRLDILDPSAWSQLPEMNFIISNPPYVTSAEKQFMQENVIAWEPHLALFVADDDPLKYYKAIANFARSHLLKNGLLYFEINERFSSEVRTLLQQSGFENTEISRDMNGKVRFSRSIS